MNGLKTSLKAQEESKLMSNSLNEPAQSSGRRRIMKLCEVNESEKMLPSFHPEEESFPDEQKFWKFRDKDEEDL